MLVCGCAWKTPATDELISDRNEVSVADLDGSPTERIAQMSECLLERLLAPMLTTQEEQVKEVPKLCANVGGEATKVTAPRSPAERRLKAWLDKQSKK